MQAYATMPGCNDESNIIAALERLRKLQFDREFVDDILIVLLDQNRDVGGHLANLRIQSLPGIWILKNHKGNFLINKDDYYGYMPFYLIFSLWIGMNIYLFYLSVLCSHFQLNSVPRHNWVSLLTYRNTSYWWLLIMFSILRTSANPLCFTVEGRDREGCLLFVFLNWFWKYLSMSEASRMGWGAMWEGHGKTFLTFLPITIQELFFFPFGFFVCVCFLFFVVFLGSITTGLPEHFFNISASS